MQPTFLSIFPPLIVLLLAFTTKKILLAICTGIILSGAIASNFNLIQSILLIKKNLQYQAFDLGNIYIFVFLICLGIVLSIITATGGAIAIGELLTKRIHTKKGVQTASLLLSTALSIDDYLNCITSGFVMKPLSDKFNIARIKLSFLINSMTAPLTILVPISSWAGVILKDITQSGITTNGKRILFYADSLTVFLETIPFIFYSFLMIISTWFIVRKNISYGIIKEHEDIANSSGCLFGKDNMPDLNPKTISVNGTIWDFLIPMLTLFSIFILGILYTGNSIIIGGTNNLVETLKAAKIYPVLFTTGIVSLITSTANSLLRKKLTFKSLIPLFKEGTTLMLPAIILIFCAWTFSTMLRDDLHTGAYIAQNLLKSVTLLLVPFVLFLTTTSVSLIIGSAWGTIALMMPITTDILSQFYINNFSFPMNPNDICIFLPSLGAVLSGAVAGNHLSPMADVSIMATTSTGANHMHHVKGQLSYAFPVFVATSLSYLISGYLSCHYTKTLTIGISLAIGIFISLSIISIINFISHKR